MREELANLVHPILAAGLNLRDRLLLGQEPAIATEQAVLRSLLLSDREAARWPDFGGSRGEPFLGVRYALVCWLDELFTLESPWERLWNENKLEMMLYRSNDRAWKFWEQAHLAESRPDTDALETFYLCVLLGFRGEQRLDSHQLKSWTSAAQTRVAPVRGREWQAPLERDPVTHVPPLRGRDGFQRMIMVGGVALLLMIPTLAFLLVRKASQ